MKKIISCVFAALGIASSCGAASLPAGGVLGAGQTLWSTDGGSYYLTMQATDGHLVLYRNFYDKKAIWYTGKPAGAGGWATVQSDRNFVVYKAGAGTPSSAVWSSNTNSTTYDNGMNLVLRNNGALYLHTSTGKIIWSTPVDPMAATGCAPNAPLQSYPICTRPNTYPRTSAQQACSFEEAARIVSGLQNDGAVMGPCE